MSVSAQATHLLLSDESSHNQRYVTISFLSGKKEHILSLEAAIIQLMKGLGVQLFSWERESRKLHRVDTTKQFIRKILLTCLAYPIRLDTVILDMTDKRHNTSGREGQLDREKNYAYIYCQVVEYLFRKRWDKPKLKWEIYPHQTEAINWAYIKRRLHSFLASGENDSQLLDIYPSAEMERPLLQMVDLFAGLTGFSWKSYHQYSAWLDGKELTISNSTQHRFEILNYLLTYFSQMFAFTMTEKFGLKTHVRDSYQKVNFWYYTPRNENNIAPLKPKKGTNLLYLPNTQKVQ